jgi:hypothetical protein
MRRDQIDWLSWRSSARIEGDGWSMEVSLLLRSLLARLGYDQQGVEEKPLGVSLEARKLREDLMPLWLRRGGLI